MGKAAFVSSNEVSVACNDGTKRTVWAKKFVLAVGAQPLIPPFLEGRQDVPYS